VRLAKTVDRYAGFDILPFDKEHGFSVVERLRAIAKTYDASVAQCAGVAAGKTGRDQCPGRNVQTCAA
jgi:hypothetical protein